MTREEIAYAVILGLLVNEATDICPWVSVRLVRWAAWLRYSHAPERAATRGEELAALVNDRPGKLFKLFTALGFALHALTVAGLRTTPRGVRWLGASAIRLGNHHETGLARVGALAAFMAIFGIMTAVDGAAEAWDGALAVAGVVGVAMFVVAAAAYAGAFAIDAGAGADGVEAGVVARVVGVAVGVAAALAVGGVVALAVGVAVGLAVGVAAAVGVTALVVGGAIVDQAVDRGLSKLEAR